MKTKIITVDEYINELPEDRKEAMTKLRNLCVKNLKKTEEMMAYGMIGYVVPLSIFPAGYHCTPGQALPFIMIASMKNAISFHHMGMYAHKPTLDWFVEEYPKHSKAKLDMGKACIRFKKMEDIPFKLIEELLKKVSAADWLEWYVELVDTRVKKK
jgi:uncharacterized protein YdhG (YjbR/CyaY superfamily)